MKNVYNTIARFSVARFSNVCICALIVMLGSVVQNIQASIKLPPKATAAQQRELDATIARVKVGDVTDYAAHLNFLYSQLSTQLTACLPKPKPAARNQPAPPPFTAAQNSQCRNAYAALALKEAEDCLGETTKPSLLDRGATPEEKRALVIKDTADKRAVFESFKAFMNTWKEETGQVGIGG